MTDYMSKKTKIIISAIVIVLIVVGLVGIKIFNNIQEQKNTEAILSSINADYKKFVSEDSRARKLEILKTQLEEFNKVKKSEDSENEIIKEYQENIDSMKEYFISDYDSQISKNTIENIEKNDDKKLINDSKENLENLMKTIELENSIVMSGSEFDKYENQIKDLVKSYENRINEIEEAEKKVVKETTTKKVQKVEKTTNETTISSTQNSSEVVSGNISQNIVPPGYDYLIDEDTHIVYYPDGSWEKVPDEWFW